jgi:hypothetical protein
MVSILLCLGVQLSYHTVRSEQGEKQQDLRREHRHDPVAAAYDRLEALEYHFGAILRRQHEERDDHGEEHYNHVRCDEALQKRQISDEVDIDQVDQSGDGDDDEVRVPWLRMEAWVGEGSDCRDDVSGKKDRAGGAHEPCEG